MKFNTKVIVGITLSLTSIIGLFYLLPHSDTGSKREITKVNIPPRQVIIRDSVDEPLPPTAKNVQTMPNKHEPQPLPNAELNKPIVITKMPLKKN
ncbi:hypothetical protein [Fictibacillus sp. 26RED30]|uniref:hypothetical protein n=1 Tax=Fictibacillus sp. 26RED30 TaxID=2745877 RepID=UPI0018CD08A2|nr:hypothetical protein [Fictibacillus sp. 26RED30]MBH0162076.1 hypothetical protein [Fictibacillus sp. 26RED30]